MSIRTISSRENPQYKSLRQLASSAQARKKSAQTVLDGIHLCSAWLQHRGAPLTCVVSESARAHSEVIPIVDACLALGAPVALMSDALFAPLSQVENGIGLLFVIDIPPAAGRAELKTAAVLLDGVQDPGNLGSILRTAAAAGISHVYCGSGTVLAWSPKVLRAGMGAHFALDIAENIDLSALIGASRVPVLATSSHAHSSLYDLDLRMPCAWLFGNEGRGVSDVLLALCTHRLSIPQRSTIESLNVAASAAVCLFEQIRQQGATR
jgi:TrmH family RNA methyltransferase